MDTHSTEEPTAQDSTIANGSSEERSKGPKPRAKTTPPKPASRKLRKLIRKSEENSTLEPFQVELLKLQRHLEVNDRKMIVIFEGRDAAGKGGTIRRVTRYMNEKHYRVVALGKPTEEQRTQWYLQKYVAEFPRGGEMVLFDRSWYNRAMVEPRLWFLHREGASGLLARRGWFRKGHSPTGNNPGQALFLGHQEGTATSIRSPSH